MYLKTIIYLIQARMLGYEIIVAVATRDNATYCQYQPVARKRLAE